MGSAEVTEGRSVASHADVLVTPTALEAELSGAAPPLLIDARAAEQFARGQIRGAVHLDLWGVSLVDTSEAPLRAFMWMIGHLFSLRGVTAERRVVVYELDAGIRAARVFWLLELLGHDRVRVLDGGIRAWMEGGRPLAADPVTPVPSPWHGELTPQHVATWQHVRSRLGDADTVLVDTRSEDEYRGRVVRAKRGGAIPGAVHLEWKRNLAPDGRYRPADDLRRMYGAIGVTPDREIITYCQGGYRAAHTDLALRLLGFPRVRNYTGSWKEWGDRDDLPIEHP
jgi:thiosulfate/3-mercaptopyruvate sulfurtransferase